MEQNVKVIINKDTGFITIKSNKARTYCKAENETMIDSILDEFLYKNYKHDDSIRISFRYVKAP